MVGKTTKVGTGQIVERDRISIGQTLWVGQDTTTSIEAETLEVVQDNTKIL